ncbi:MAG: GNAT family N-acetyltransferase, partial [Pseudomonadota bacterium]
HPHHCGCVGQWHADGDRGDQARDAAPFVIIAHARDDRVTGVWPLQGERHLGCLFAVVLGEPFSQYADILIAEDADEDAIIYAFLEALRSLGRFSGVVLRKVRQDAICRPYIAEDAMIFGEGAAPAVDLRPFEDFDAYHRTIKSKTRKNLRNARNRLMRDGSGASGAGGDVTHRVHRDPEAIAEVAHRAFRLRADFLAQRGETSRAFLDTGFSSFVAQLCTCAEVLGLTLVAFELTCGDQMVSLQWGFIDRGRYYAFIAVRNPAFDAHSPGRLHLEDVLRSAASQGIEVVDFLAPEMDYKKTWASEAVGVQDHGLAFTPGGRLALVGAFGAPRRWAQAAFGALPSDFRRSALRLLTRRS